MSDAARQPGSEEQRLRSALAERERQIAQLSRELTETNKGVVALYAELDDRAVALREVSELKSRFLSYMSHEFRTPLGAIRSMARLLLDRMDGPLSAEQEKQVRFMDGAAADLTELVNDLLDLAKIEAGRISVHPVWFHMAELFAGLRGMFRPILTNDRVELIVEEPADVDRVYTDDKRLTQILRNFISNALKFTEEGAVRVSCRHVADDRVTISVEDTGIGIAPEHQRIIFDDFTQVDSPLQRKLRGTGLGLAISRKIADLLGGVVGMTSTPGEGSVFSVTIPICYGNAEDVPATEEATDAR
ncbi:MAG TPA: ATP-binding protein [Phycisphaerae bacterium]|nr:histidine kinase [Phycisphaerales bacterium]HRX84251.1 ATP-binding protein [Phycisphaerae bacterium]